MKVQFHLCETPYLCRIILYPWRWPSTSCQIACGFVIPNIYMLRKQGVRTLRLKDERIQKSDTCVLRRRNARHAQNFHWSGLHSLPTVSYTSHAGRCVRLILCMAHFTDGSISRGHVMQECIYSMVLRGLEAKKCSILPTRDRGSEIHVVIFNLLHSSRAKMGGVVQMQPALSFNPRTSFNGSNTIMSRLFPWPP